jgi:hypothetical protein
MPTFRQIAAPLVVAGMVGAGLTGVLSAQTAPGGRDGSAIAEAASTGPADQASALFTEGHAAYRDGNMAEAIRHWESAARDGHLAAQWNLARIFSGAAGGPADPRRHLHYLQLAAAQHDPDALPGPRLAVTLEALVELARAYGAGVPEVGLAPQPARARAMLEHAASLFGHARAQHFLGLMYLKGDGMSADLPRAVRWLHLAARKQYAPSQAALGEYFLKRAAARGDDAGDRMRGVAWIALASRNARAERTRALFLERYEQAMGELGEAERERVRTLVDSWSAGQKSAALEPAE